MHSRETDLYRRTYPLRILGMGLAAPVMGMVLWERGAPLAEWLAMLFATLVWPHIAFVAARSSAHRYRTEMVNLLIDSTIAGAAVVLMDFNLLPSVMLVTLTVVDKITTGVHGLWARSLLVMPLGAAVCALLTGVTWAPTTSMAVMLACLPMMVLHSLGVSTVSYRLIRKVSRQNLQLHKMRQVDALTGLYTRSHWRQQAETALRKFHTQHEPACMLMLDIDRFKSINDVHGHTVGDEVIRALAHVVLRTVRVDDCAGRFGGDEFAIILPGMQAKDAFAVAERIRVQAENVRLRSRPTLRITSSIGIAMADHRYTTVRDWTHAADMALYAAKHAGRNQVASHDEPEPIPAI